eukprot:557625-Pleurochrysis_carterae.AAC.2
MSGRNVYQSRFRQYPYSSSMNTDSFYDMDTRRARIGLRSASRTYATSIIISKKDLYGYAYGGRGAFILVCLSMAGCSRRAR